jgi:hypothetical protein
MNESAPAASRVPEQKGKETIMATQSNTLPGNLPKKIITTDADATLGNLDSQIQVFSQTDPATPGESHVISMPPNPQLGQEHLVVAVTAGATLDGNGSTIMGATTVNIGECAKMVFTQDPALASSNCNCAGAGAWVNCG